MTREQSFQSRYKRHLMLPEVGDAGQRKLLNAQALVVGAGGLGSPVALYLAAAGVGHLHIVDDDCVDISNLQRQIIHAMPDVGKPKALSAKEKINRLNPDVVVTAHQCRFDEGNALRLIAPCDLIIDATDNAASKFLINDTCVKAGKPLVHGAIQEFSGNVMTILPGSATLRDLFNVMPKGNSPASNYGVLGAIPGIVGSIQAAEALKIILGAGELLVNRVLTIDALTLSFNIFNVTPARHCKIGTLNRNRGNGINVPNI